jgi:hypothetical protein
MKLLGNLYRHGILQPDYKEEWIRRDKRRTEESVLWRWHIDTDWTTPRSAVGEIKDEALR